MGLLEKFKDTNFSITLSHNRMKLNSIQITSYLKRQIHETQTSDEFL